MWEWRQIYTVCSSVTHLFCVLTWLGLKMFVYHTERMIEIVINEKCHILVQFPHLYFITNKITSVQTLTDALKCRILRPVSPRCWWRSFGKFLFPLAFFLPCWTYKVPTSRSRCSIWAGENNCNGYKPADVTWQPFFKGPTVLDLTARPWTLKSLKGLEHSTDDGCVLE